MKIGRHAKNAGAVLLTTFALAGGAFSGQAIAAADRDQSPAIKIFARKSATEAVKRGQLVGTWRILKKNGEWMVLSFNRHGGFALILSSSPQRIIAGKWRLSDRSVRVVFLKVCNRKLKCTALPAAGRQRVAIRILQVKGNSVRTSEGVMRPMKV